MYISMVISHATSKSIYAVKLYKNMTKEYTLFVIWKDKMQTDKINECRRLKEK